MLKTFFGELEPVYFDQAPSTSIDSGISDSIRNASKLTMTKVIENDNGKAQMSITADREQEKEVSQTYGKTTAILALRSVVFQLKK